MVQSLDNENATVVHSTHRSGTLSQNIAALHLYVFARQNFMEKCTLQINIFRQWSEITEAHEKIRSYHHLCHQQPTVAEY